MSDEQSQTTTARPTGTDDYPHVFGIHPDWKHGECRECGELWWVHKDVQTGAEPAETTCPECNHHYNSDFLKRMMDVEVRI